MQGSDISELQRLVGEELVQHYIHDPTKELEDPLPPAKTEGNNNTDGKSYTQVFNIDRFYQNIYRMWSPVADIVFDILTIRQYHQDESIPTGFVWALIIVLSLSIRFQGFWIVFHMQYKDHHESDGPMFPVITLRMALCSYLPIGGLALTVLFSLLLSEDEGMIPLLLRIGWEGFVFAPLLDLVGVLMLLVGPFAIIYFALQLTKERWNNRHHPHQAEDEFYMRTLGTMGRKSDSKKLTVFGIENFIERYEAILESLPQVAIITYVTLYYSQDSLMMSLRKNWGSVLSALKSFQSALKYFLALLKDGFEIADNEYW